MTDTSNQTPPAPAASPAPQKGAMILVNGIPHSGRVELVQIPGGGWSIDSISVEPLITPETAASKK